MLRLPEASDRKSDNTCAKKRNHLGKRKKPNLFQQ